MTPPPTVTVPVDLAERSYNIHIGESLSEQLPRWLEECLPKCRHAVLVVDANVEHIAADVANA
ncbi:MAG: hypothetical protein KDA72_06160, partial [Planctomycetales bacterium]|nr:hypothetical protein [Planctomycetales bacterium]